MQTYPLLLDLCELMEAADFGVVGGIGVMFLSISSLMNFDGRTNRGLIGALDKAVVRRTLAFLYALPSNGIPSS